MSKLIISKLLVERVAESLHNRNELYSSALLPPDANAAVLAVANKQAFSRFVRHQPGMLAFYLITTVKLSEEGQSVGLFLCEVIMDAFLLAGWQERRVDALEFIEALNCNRAVARQIRPMQSELSQQNFRAAQIFRQSELISYLADEILLDGNNKVCPHKMLRDDYLGQLFLVLKSIIDVLDKDSDVNPNAN